MKKLFIYELPNGLVHENPKPKIEDRHTSNLHLSVRLRASSVDMTRALQLISAAIFLTLVILSCATDAGMCVYFKLEFAIF